MLLSELFAQINYEAEESEEGDQLVLTKPSSIDEDLLPFLFGCQENYGSLQSFLTMEQIAEYFKVQLTDTSVYLVEGLTVAEWWGNMYCDYCRGDIPHEIYYWCRDCHSDMCEMCFVETCEAIAVANGAINYRTRMERLQNCQMNHRQEKRSLRGIADPYCDICTMDRGDSLTFWCKQGDFDVCESCWNEEKNKEEIGDRSDYYQSKRVRCTMEITSFGSLLDWVPWLNSEPGHMVLVNINKDSPYHACLGVCCVDDNGRAGYFVLDSFNVWKDGGTKDFAAILLEYDCKFPNEKDEGFPIAKMAHEKFGCQISYS